MKKVISVIYPFDYKQSVYVYEDGNKIDSDAFALDDLPDGLLQLAAKYNISNIDLVGPKQFAQSIKTNTLMKKQQCYSNQNITISII